MTTETTNDPIAPNAPASIAAAASQPSELPAESPVYQAFKLPDGMSIDEQALSEAMALFQQARLDQTTAQKFVDLAMAREQAVHRRNAQAFNDLQEKWTGEIKSDPDIGGDRLAASLVAAARAIDRLGVSGLREALNVTGAGNHPAIVKAFVRLGQMLSEDRFRPGGAAAPATPRSPADVIYDGTPRR